MSEFAPKMPEMDNLSPEISKAEQAKENRIEKESDRPEKSAENNAEDLRNIRHKVENLAHSKNESKIDKPKQNTSHVLVSKQLKQEMLTKTIKKVQKKLNPTQRTLSKIVHNPTVDKISNVSEKTVARPYGILGGGLLALLGSIFSTYLTKQFGLPYNLLVFVLLFTLGYLVTTLFELLIKVLKHSKS